MFFISWMFLKKKKERKKKKHWRNLFFLVKEFLGSTKRCWLYVKSHMLRWLQLTTEELLIRPQILSKLNKIIFLWALPVRK